MQQSSTGCMEQIISVLVGILMAFFMGADAASQMPAATPPPQAVLSIELVLQPAGAATEAQMNEALMVVQARLDTLLAGSQVAAASAALGDVAVVVQFAPGTMALEEVQRVLTQPGLLEIVDVGDMPPEQAQSLVGTTLASSLRPESANGRPVYQTILSNADVAQAEAVEDQNTGGYTVVVDFTPEGAATLSEFTESHLNQVLPVMLDGVVLIAPVIYMQVAETAVISGSFSADQAAVLAAQISTPPLPVALVLASINIIQ